MVSPVGISSLAVDASFAQFGWSATYAPPTGSAALCTVIKDQRDLDAPGFLGRPTLQGNVIEVRKSEVAAPVKGGVFVILDTTQSLVIQDDPKCEDPDRLVWTCTVA